MTVQWIAGDHHGLVWPHGLAVLGADVPLEAALALWSRFAAGGDLAHFLKEVSARAGVDLLSLPDFAVALRMRSGWQLAARGAFEVRAGGVIVRGAGMTTWAERRLDADGAVVVGLAEAAGDARPLVAGVVPAASLAWGDRAAVELVETPASVELVETPASVELVETPAEEELETRVPEPEASEPEASEPEASEPEASEPEASEPEPDLQPEPATPPGRFARMYGDTRLWSVEDAAVRPGTEEAPGMIAVPSFAPPTPPASGLDIDSVGDHDGATMVASDLIPPPPAPAEPADLDAGPTVLAVECVHGHPNPPQRSLCSECGGAIVGEPRRVPRPSLGTLALPGGERIDLTAPVILGRRPRAERVQGPILPRLVPLTQGHVSGSHLEIRLEEWNVLAVDLHSTNGTFLRRQGESPVRLGEPPVLLVQGDVLDLGHGVQVRLEFLR